jgi:hypothetical protein
MKDPIIINELLNNKDRLEIIESLGNPKSFSFDPFNGRYSIDDNSLPILGDVANKLIDKAREVFDSKSLLPTYVFFSHYEGQHPVPKLLRHKDTNACTYTLDLCLYQTEPWDLFVEDKKYTLYENQALAFYGCDQWHWRKKFPNPENGHCAMIFFHFAEPEHWYFTKGPTYIEVVLKKITEEQWNLKMLDSNQIK